MKRLLSIIGLLSLGLSGCVVTHDDDDPYWYTGYLTVDWTVDGTHLASECRFFGADAISIVVESEDEGWTEQYVEDCEAFSLSIELDPGRYWGDAVMLDVVGNEITTHADFRRFTIYGDDELIMPIDFPVDSFR